MKRIPVFSHDRVFGINGQQALPIGELSLTTEGENIIKNAMNSNYLIYLYPEGKVTKIMDGKVLDFDLMAISIVPSNIENKNEDNISNSDNILFLAR